MNVAPMKAHQRLIREQLAETGAASELFGAWWNEIDCSIQKASVDEISSDQAAKIILTYEWLGTMPQAVTRCFGLFHDGILSGALVFAMKPGANLVSDKTSIVPADALYLARGACAHWAHPHAASFLIASVARRFLARPSCTILAYADPLAGEIGTIYQACGWYYLGPSKGGPHAFRIDGKLINVRSFNRDRRYKVGQSIEDVRLAYPRATSIETVGRKGRYLGVYGDKTFKRQMRERISAAIQPYPKRTVNP